MLFMHNSECVCDSPPTHFMTQQNGDQAAPFPGKIPLSGQARTIGKLSLSGMEYVRSAASWFPFILRIVQEIHNVKLLLALLEQIVANNFNKKKAT